MLVDGPESTDKDDLEEEQYSIAKDRSRRNIRPPQRYANLVTYALSVVEETSKVGEPTTYSDAVSFDNSAKWLIAEGKVLVQKIYTKDNPVDMFTKPLPVYKFKQCLDLVGVHY